MTWDMAVAARTLYGEARGETESAQRAIAHILVNRLRARRWGDNLASVCLAPMQFSAWNASDPNRIKMAAVPEDDPMLVKLGEFIEDALSGEPDPTNNGTHYFADSMIKPPSWVVGATFCGKFGHHLVYRDVK